MARLMMPEDGDAMPGMSYYSPAGPNAQAPYYLIPQHAHSIPHYSDAPPRYVYSPTEYGQSAPGLKLVPPQSYHYHVDPAKKDLHEALKQIPQGFVAPNARHPVYVLPDGTMVGQPVHHNGYPVYDNASRAHLHPFGNQQPGGAQYANCHPFVSETLPAAQPGMRWKLVPVAEREDATPIASPKASAAPVMLLKSPEEEPDCAGDDDPYKKLLSRLFSKPEDESQTKDGASKVEVKRDTPKSVRIIPVTDAPKDDPKSALDQAHGQENACSSSLKKQVNKSSTPTLKPIRLVPSLDFVKKKPAAGTSKQEKSSQLKPDSHQTCDVKVSAPDEAGSKMVEKRARENSGSDVESDTVQTAKKRLITDSETAARLIQSVFRGYLVRRCQPLKHLRDIVRVMKEYRALAANKSALLERCKDPAEWTKVSEAIMSLLLRLDVIEGVDPVVRDIRKYTSKEVLTLQSEVDAVKPKPEEQVDHLLLKLLEKLLSSGQPVDRDLKSEVVKRLSLLQEQEQEKDTDTTALEKQGESTVPEMAGANCSDGMADDAAIDTKLPVSSPTELELQKVKKTVAADFVDVFHRLRHAHSEDTVASVQSMVEKKADMLKGQGILDSYDRALLEVCEGVDVSNDMGEEASKHENVESKMEGTGQLALTEIADTGETQAEKFNVVDGEDKERTSELEAREEKLANGDLLADLKDESACEECSCKESVMAPEAATDSDFVKPLADEEKVSNADVIADLKDVPASIEFACEECHCKEFGMAQEAATDSDSVKPVADEEKIPTIDLVADLKDDTVSTEAGFDSPDQATLSSLSESEDAVEVTEVDNAPAEASPSDLAEGLWNGLDSCCHDVHAPAEAIPASDSAEGLWNGFDSCCHDVHRSPCQPFAQDSEGVAIKPSHAGVDEPCNTISTISDEESEKADMVEKSMKIQVPDRSFSPQECSVPGDSPTSVLDAGISMAPTEEFVVSEDVAMNEKETLQCAISDLESLNNEGECFLHDESMQLESAISDLHSLNNSGQGFLNDLSPNGATTTPSSMRMTTEVYLPKPPSLSPEALDLLEHGVESSERLSPSSNLSPRSEASLTQHLMEENAVLKGLLKDVLKWSQWQSTATLSLHMMMEKLALELLETKAPAKKAARSKHGKHKKAAKKRSHCKV